MNVEQNDHLKDEQTLGRQAQAAYESFIMPFITNKAIQLHEAFVDCPITETETILEIKRNLHVLDSLGKEVQTIITTGKMASQELLKQPHSKH